MSRELFREKFNGSESGGNRPISGEDPILPPARISRYRNRNADWIAHEIADKYPGRQIYIAGPPASHLQRVFYFVPGVRIPPERQDTASIWLKRFAMFARDIMARSGGAGQFGASIGPGLTAASPL